MNNEDLIAEISTDICNALALSDQTLLHTIEKYCTCFGAENFFFGSALYQHLQPCPEICILTNYPKAWQERYAEKQYFNQDLTVAHCKGKSTPIVWPTKNKHISRTNKIIFSEASNYSLKSGISIPYHAVTGEYGALAVSSSEHFEKSDLNKPENLFSLQLLGSCLFDIIRLKNKQGRKKALTEREKECLKWVAVGKSSWVISKIIGISKRTVEFHITNAGFKMGTTSRTSAVVIALLSGEIEL